MPTKTPLSVLSQSSNNTESKVFTEVPMPLSSEKSQEKVINISTNN